MTLEMHQLLAAPGQGQAVLSAQACISKLDPITILLQQLHFPLAPHPYGVLAFADVLCPQKLQLFVDEYSAIKLLEAAPWSMASSHCSSCITEGRLPSHTQSLENKQL